MNRIWLWLLPKKMTNTSGKSSTWPYTLAFVCIGALTVNVARQMRDLPPLTELRTAAGVLWLAGSDDYHTPNLRAVPGQHKARSAPPHCPEAAPLVVDGHCWVILEQRAPGCPEGTAAYNGKCVMPYRAQKPRPVSVEESSR